MREIATIAKELEEAQVRRAVLQDEFNEAEITRKNELLPYPVGAILEHPREGRVLLRGYIVGRFGVEHWPVGHVIKKNGALGARSDKTIYNINEWKLANDSH